MLSSYKTRGYSKFRMEKKLMTEPGKIGTIQCICVVKLLFLLARQDTNGKDYLCALCFYSLPATPCQNAFFCWKFCLVCPRGGAWCFPAASSSGSGAFLPPFHRHSHFHKIVASKTPNEPPQAGTPSAVNSYAWSFPSANLATQGWFARTTASCPVCFAYAFSSDTHSRSQERRFPLDISLN